MDRRRFLKQTGLTLTGLIAAASAFEALPVAAAGPTMSGPAQPVRDRGAVSRPIVTRLAVQAPGEYRISGRVRLEAPNVEISGIANAQHISWSGAAGRSPSVVSFSSFERYERGGLTPEITVHGGRLESISIVPVDDL